MILVHAGGVESQTGEKRLLKKLLPYQKKICIRNAVFRRETDKRFRDLKSKTATGFLAWTTSDKRNAGLLAPALYFYSIRQKYLPYGLTVYTSR